MPQTHQKRCGLGLLCFTLLRWKSKRRRTGHSEAGSQSHRPDVDTIKPFNCSKKGHKALCDRGGFHVKLLEDAVATKPVSLQEEFEERFAADLEVARNEKAQVERREPQRPAAAYYRVNVGHEQNQVVEYYDVRREDPFRKDAFKERRSWKTFFRAMKPTCITNSKGGQNAHSGRAHKRQSGFHCRNVGE
jgi:hypothetical protein